jgi:multiple sugar transport system permease protein
VILPAGYYPFGVYLAYVYFTNELPDSLLEAARIDGASELRILMRIVLPLAKPLMGLLSFFSFVGAWSNFLLPYLMLNDERDYPLPLGLSVLPIGDAISGAPNLTGMPTSQGEVILAGLITVAPILVMFLFSQRFLVSAQLAGAEKS